MSFSGGTPSPPIILPLVPCRFWGYPSDWSQVPSQGYLGQGTPSQGWGSPQPGQGGGGYPIPGNRGSTCYRRTVCLLCPRRKTFLFCLLFHLEYFHSHVSEQAPSKERNISTIIRSCVRWRRHCVWPPASAPSSTWAPSPSIATSESGTLRSTRESTQGRQASQCA